MMTSIFDGLEDVREKREPLPPQKAIVAFGGVTASTAILWCTPELKFDIEQAGIDDEDVFEHGACENPDQGVWVWEGTIRGITYPATPDHPEEYDVGYPGTWRPLTEDEWDRVLGLNMYRRDWSGPCTDIKVLSGAEAIRKRPGFYGLTDAQVEAMSDAELEVVAANATIVHPGSCR